MTQTVRRLGGSHKTGFLGTGRWGFLTELGIGTQISGSQFDDAASHWLHNSPQIQSPWGSMVPWRHARVFLLSFFFFFLPFYLFFASLEGIRPKSSDFCWESHHPSPSQDPPAFSEPSSESRGCCCSSHPFSYWLWVGNQPWMV